MLNPTSYCQIIDRSHEELLILGASTRAAALSARRAGLNPVCLDLFADQDLAACCPVIRLPAREFPEGFYRLACGLPRGPWLYVGAMENHPELVGRISLNRPLWGNGKEVLVRVRDPFQLADCLGKAGLAYPAVRAVSDGVTATSSWLIKPFASAGGRGISEFTGWGAKRMPSARRGMYLQQRIEGPSCAAVYVGLNRRAALIGVTRQLIGEPAYHAKPFHYCGSVGPLPLEPSLVMQLSRLGDALAAEFGLVGLFGVDGILADGVFWALEVNPRYTASVEVLELGFGLSAMAMHREACSSGTLSWKVSDSPGGSDKLIGKAILFAAESTIVPDLSILVSATIGRSDPWWIPSMADIPNEGEEIGSGRPICTVFASASSIEACCAGLAHAARRVIEHIGHEG